MQHYRQGDVMIVRVSKLPANAQAVDNVGRVVLAHGEVTGHAHAIPAAQATEYTLEQAGQDVRRFLSVMSGGGTVTHEEHSAIQLPEGVYEIVQQAEYSPDAIRNVAD